MPALRTPFPASCRILPTQLLLSVDTIHAACALLQCPAPVPPAAALDATPTVSVMGTVAAVGPVRQGTDTRQSLRSRNLVSRCVHLQGEGGAVPLWLYDDHVR